MLWRSIYIGVRALALTLPLALLVQAQDRRPRVDVEHYVINAEINPATQSLTATVEVRLAALDATTAAAVFELNNALALSRVEDEAGRQIPASRTQQDFSVRLSFPEPLVKGKTATLKFSYEGRLTGAEDSPVYGIKFASIQNNFAYLMYPARWFPVNDYTVDRYTADLHLTTPAGYTLVCGEMVKTESAAEKTIHHARFLQSTFPGSLALVQGEAVRVSSDGAAATIWFRGDEAAMARAYGEETGKVMVHLTSLYGLPPYSSLAIVETDNGAPTGYSAPGLIFLSPRGIGKQVNPRLLANQIARQWWGALLSPVTRNHLWLTNGMACYAEMLYIEHTNGPGALEADARDTYIEALTVENVTLSQSAGLEDYSPEYWAATAKKGAAVYHMLRYVLGDDVFLKVLKAVPEQFAWKPLATADFRLVAEKLYGKRLDFFIIQWIESTGAPEFKLEYTVFRTQKGFRVMGKIAQDLDTFRMPMDLKIETEGNPEEKRVEVSGTSSEFVIETFGKPKSLAIDPNNKVLRLSDQVRVAVSIRRGEQFAELGEYGEALREYQRSIEVNRNSSLAHYRVADVFFLQNNYQSAANEYREALNGDLEPKWTEVWSHINLGKIFDVTGQRERAVNEYNLALRTKDNTQGAQEEAARYLKTPYERPRQNY